LFTRVRLEEPFEFLGQSQPQKGRKKDLMSSIATLELMRPELEVATIQFPDENAGALNQDEEWCFIETEDGERKRIRFHDYDEVFSVPGLYEFLFYEKLECMSPQTVVGLLREEVKSEMDMSELSVLDVGAGNGMVGEMLSYVGTKSIVGLDIIDEAREATFRDRPGVYLDYLVQDLTALPESTQRELEGKKFNCLISVAALGFGDIPPRAFANAYNFVGDGGWIAFNIKEDFLDESVDLTGFSRLVSEMFEYGVMERKVAHTYRHRISVKGDPLNYVAIVARKERDVPESMVRGIE
jgi:SAM-dependent methyltransferase